MASILIPCPKCGMELRLRDRKLLGRQGKCPKCAHRFLLEEPDEVELELADSPAAANSTAVVGKAAQWVPENGGPAVSAPQTVPGINVPIDPDLERVRQATGRKLRGQKKKKSNVVVIAGSIVTLLVLVAGGLYALNSGPAKKPLPTGEESLAATEVTPEIDPGEPETYEVLASDNRTARSPTKGEPIQLLFIPSGARIIINLRPAELLSAGGLGEGEFMASLGPLGIWLTAKLQEICMDEPAKIEEALICLIPGPRGSPPDVATVVHLKEEAKKSDLLERFAGQRMDDLGRVYYLGTDRAYLIHDTKTYAIVPSSMAEEMVRASDYANPTDTGLEELLTYSDRNRMFTMLLIPQDLRLHGEFLAPDNAQDFLQTAGDWLASDGEVEAALWSFHVGNTFYSELLLRNSNIIKPSRLQRNFQESLTKTPHRILDAIQKMNPASLGKKYVIGRVPAMSQVVATSMQLGTGSRHISLVTELPERAAPNLALGTLLAWDESTRTDFSQETKPTSPGTTSNVPELIADRFKTKIDVDFRREPLFAAFEYVANEAKFDLSIDGDALKMEGYTKNMPQTFKIDAVPSGKALQEILKAYPQMTVVVDEQKKHVTVTTLKAASAKSLTPFKFSE